MEKGIQNNIVNFNMGDKIKISLLLKHNYVNVRKSLKCNLKEWVDNYIFDS